MSFSFGDILDIGRTVIGIGSLFNEQDPPTGSAQMLQAANQSARFARALDPNSEMFLSLVDEEEARIKREFTEGLRLLSVRNRRELARGRPGILINPERRDEAIAQASARGLQTAREQARRSARDFIAQAAGLNTQASGAFGGVTQAFGPSEQFNQNRAAERPLAVLEGLSSIFNSATSGPQQGPSADNALNQLVGSTVFGENRFAFT